MLSSCGHGFRCSLVAVGAALGCGPPEPPRVEIPSFQVVAEPNLDGGVAAPFARFRIAAMRLGDLGAVHLFEGEVGEYHERRVRRQDIPQTLEDRRVPAFAYADAVNDETIVLPGRLLEPGPHSLVTERYGVLAAFVAGDGHEGVAARVWPPGGEVTAGRHVVYCGDQVASTVGAAVTFEPGPVTAQVVESGETPAGDACVMLAFSGDLHDRQVVAPPIDLAGTFLEPSPVQIGVGPATVPVDCVPPEQPFGPGCATVEDDRILLRPPAVPMLWWLGIGNSEPRVLVGAGAPLVVVGFVPGRRSDVSILALGLDGMEYRAEASMEMSAPRPHVVIDEVLADVLGPEPDQEWVELVNDGKEAVNLGGWTIEDSGGASELPRVEVAAGERVVLVSERFTLPNDPDVPVPAHVTLVRVHSIGANGLSNAGEKLRLRDDAGIIVSVFPAIAAPASGVSVCRFAPWSPDDDPSAFGEHDSPGASPGGPCAWAAH